MKLLVSDNEFHMAQTLHYLKSVKGIIITKQAAETTELQWENTESGGVKAKLLGTKGWEMENKVLVSCSHEPTVWTWVKHQTSFSLSYLVCKMKKLGVTDFFF